MTQYERHPLSAEYADLEGEAWECFLDGFSNYGFLDKPIVRYDGKILDGWQRYRACTTLGIQPTFQGMPEGITPEEYVRLVNDERRHESAAAKAKRVADRRERVAAARVEGKSLRTIAEEEGISHIQVGKDLEAAATVNRLTVEPKDGKVTGKDGKTRTATPAPKAETNGKHTGNGKAETNGKHVEPDAPKPPKVGQPYFDDRLVEEYLGKLIRLFDSRAAVYGKSQQHTECMDAMEPVVAAWRRWQRVTTSFPSRKG